MTHLPKRAKTRSIQGADRAVQQALTPEHEALHHAIKAIYAPEDPDTLSLLVSVTAELRRYKLDRAYTAADVINEAFVRAIAAINKGKSIPAPIAWLRLACRYIIKEKSRGKKREAQMETIERIADPLIEPEWPLGEGLSDQHQQVRAHFQKLSRLNQDILILKIVEELRWEAVQERLVAMGHRHYSLGALRQKKRRALQQLRTDYL